MSAMSAESQAACGLNECGMRAENLAFSKFKENLTENVSPKTCCPVTRELSIFFCCRCGSKGWLLEVVWLWVESGTAGIRSSEPWLPCRKKGKFAKTADIPTRKRMAGSTEGSFCAANARTLNNLCEGTWARRRTWQSGARRKRTNFSVLPRRNRTTVA